MIAAISSKAPRIRSCTAMPNLRKRSGGRASGDGTPVRHEGIVAVIRVGLASAILTQHLARQRSDQGILLTRRQVEQVNMLAAIIMQVW